MSKKIYINPGHSNVDPGAVGFETERVLNVKTANFMNEHLLANYECQTMVTDGKINSTHVASAEANEWGADLFVSIHNNAAGGDGYEALVYSEKRKALGQIFEKHVLAAGQNSRGVKLRPELNVLRLTVMPAVLNEGAFVDNKKDIEDWNDDHELKKLGIAYAEAAAEYLKLEKKVAEPAPAPAPAPAPVKPMYRVFGADGKQTGAFQMESYAFNEVKKQLLVGGKATITLSEK
jgi:N-acetylmuramoyl-L-alanine amidase